ncbi:MAG: hypothetical protein ABI613_11550 [Gemmatimonadota bacterium]
MFRTNLFLTAIAGTLAFGCKPADSRTDTTAAPPTPPEPRVITVSAHEYAYQAPDTIPAGLTTIRLANTGTELHHMTIVRLNEGKTVHDLMALPENGPMPAWAVMLGGPNAAAPGDTANATLDFAAGRYALLCFIPSADGKPHAMKGMVRQLEVIPATGVAARVPDADITVSLTDFAFTMSTPITAGHHTILIRNDGAQVHEMVLVKLAPGKTAADFTSWAMTMKGPPPGRPMSGMAGMAPGQTAFVTDDFTPGAYAIVCFAPDDHDGKPHTMHGMIQDLTVS